MHVYAQGYGTQFSVYGLAIFQICRHHLIFKKGIGRQTDRRISHMTAINIRQNLAAA